MKSRANDTKRPTDNLSELIGRAVFVAGGIIVLQNNAFRDFSITVFGLALTVGPFVTVGPIENLLKLSFNRATRKVVGRDMFIVEGNIHAQTVIGQHIGDIIHSASPGEGEKHEGLDEEWDLARNFTLKGGDYDHRTIPIYLKGGQPIRGYVDAEADVCLMVLTPHSLKSFEEDEGFQALWDASGDYATLDFVPEKSGRYHVVVANFDPFSDRDEFEEDDDISVELRLKF